MNDLKHPSYYHLPQNPDIPDISLHTPYVAIPKSDLVLHTVFIFGLGLIFGAFLTAILLMPTNNNPNLNQQPQLWAK